MFNKHFCCFLFVRSIRNSVEEKAILGNQTSVEYLSNRLKFDVRTTNTIMSRHPASFNVKVTKVLHDAFRSNSFLFSHRSIHSIFR